MRRGGGRPSGRFRWALRNFKKQIKWQISENARLKLVTRNNYGKYWSANKTTKLIKKTKKKNRFCVKQLKNSGPHCFKSPWLGMPHDCSAHADYHNAQSFPCFYAKPRAGRAFLDSRSRVPGVLGTRARGNAIFFKARGNAEREEVGTLISRAWSKNAISW